MASQTCRQDRSSAHAYVCNVAQNGLMRSSDPDRDGCRHCLLRTTQFEAMETKTTYCVLKIIVVVGTLWQMLCALSVMKMTLCLNEQYL